MNEIFKNLLISISRGGDSSGGGDKLFADQDLASNNFENSTETTCNGGAGNDPTENNINKNKKI